MKKTEYEKALSTARKAKIPNLEKALKHIHKMLIQTRQ